MVFKEVMDARFDLLVPTTIIAVVKGEEDEINEIILSQTESEPYKQVVEALGEEKIRENTKDFEALIEEHKRKQEQEQELEALFKAKEDALSIPEVQNSGNDDIKEKIRTAETIAEVYYYTNKI